MRLDKQQHRICIVSGSKKKTGVASFFSYLGHFCRSNFWAFGSIRWNTLLDPHPDHQLMAPSLDTDFWFLGHFISKHYFAFECWELSEVQLQRVLFIRFVYNWMDEDDIIWISFNLMVQTITTSLTFISFHKLELCEFFWI